MVKFSGETHDFMMKGGFKYDEKTGKYYMSNEAVWDREKRIEMGRKQFAVPCSTKEEFETGYEDMIKRKGYHIDRLLAKLKREARAAGREVPDADSDGFGDEDALAPAKGRKAKAPKPARSSEADDPTPAPEARKPPAQSAAASSSTAGAAKAAAPAAEAPAAEDGAQRSQPAAKKKSAAKTAKQLKRDQERAEKHRQKMLEAGQAPADAAAEAPEKKRKMSGGSDADGKKSRKVSVDDFMASLE
eukprot:TRINITY_DN65778_c0_g1_i1.p1 TRINITY_DN65778_c0_g1~~TRINITY_DN65778_c0_g1_i1.p1  ORF type:complete len:245 (-),score=90.57 TRINITY_DN65778_c0_g1_i1:118-852(-)